MTPPMTRHRELRQVTSLGSRSPAHSCRPQWHACSNRQRSGFACSPQWHAGNVRCGSMAPEPCQIASLGSNSIAGSCSPRWHACTRRQHSGLTCAVHRGTPAASPAAVPAALQSPLQLACGSSRNQLPQPLRGILAAQVQTPRALAEQTTVEHRGARHAFATRRPRRSPSSSAAAPQHQT